MPFNMLISTCLSNYAVNREQGVKVFVNRKRGERVLFFSIDNQNYRNFIYGYPGGRVSDTLIYYRGARAMNDIFCFTELKKELNIKTLKKAVEQLKKSKEGLEEKLNEKPQCNNPNSECIRKYESTTLFPEITWLAYICYKEMPLQLPQDIKTQKRELKKVFDGCSIRDEKDIGKFLRDYIIIDKQEN